MKIAKKCVFEILNLVQNLTIFNKIDRPLKKCPFGPQALTVTIARAHDPGIAIIRMHKKR
jgi:hypothetical protein